MAAEDEKHALLECSKIKQAWEAAGLADTLAYWSQQTCNTSALVHAVCANEERETAALFATVMWVIWNNRNNSVWNNVDEPGCNLGYKAKQMWNDWFAAQNCLTPATNRAQQQQQVSWQPPPQGWYKCNVDAGFYRQHNTTSTGWCLRDDRGRFIKAGTTWLAGSCSILEGEALALLEAVQAMEQLGITQVLMETDSKTLVDAITSRNSGSSEFSNLVLHINAMLQCKPNFQVKFIKRQANMVAHTLARAAISWASRCTFETLPLCISTLLNNEMN